VADVSTFLALLGEHSNSQLCNKPNAEADLYVNGQRNFSPPDLFSLFCDVFFCHHCLNISGFFRGLRTAITATGYQILMLVFFPPQCPPPVFLRVTSSSDGVLSGSRFLVLFGVLLEERKNKHPYCGLPSIRPSREGDNLADLVGWLADELKRIRPKLSGEWWYAASGGGLENSFIGLSREKGVAWGRWCCPQNWEVGLLSEVLLSPF